MKTIANIVVAGAFLVAGVANSADWSGPYVGAHYGQAENKASGDFDTAGDDPQVNWSDEDGTGDAYGVQVGYNIQQGRMVYGVELSYTETDLDEGFVDGEDDLQEFETEDYWTIRGKVGRLINNDATLVYLTAGYAEVDAEVRTEQTPGEGSGPATSSLDADALILGLGAEHRVNDAFSIKAEVLWIDVDEGNNLQSHPDADDDRGIDTGEIWTYQIGINYYF